MRPGHSQLKFGPLLWGAALYRFELASLRTSRPGQQTQPALSLLLLARRNIFGRSNVLGTGGGGGTGGPTQKGRDREDGEASRPTSRRRRQPPEASTNHNNWAARAALFADASWNPPSCCAPLGIFFASARPQSCGSMWNWFMSCANCCQCPFATCYHLHTQTHASSPRTSQFKSCGIICGHHFVSHPHNQQLSELKEEKEEENKKVSERAKTATKDRHIGWSRQIKRNWRNRRVSSRSKSCVLKSRAELGESPRGLQQSSVRSVELSDEPPQDRGRDVVLIGHLFQVAIIIVLFFASKPPGQPIQPVWASKFLHHSDAISTDSVL